MTTIGYPLARDAIFWTLQGEGHLRGTQMAFIRLAGCSVGCPQCDTDYGVHERADLSEIIGRVLDVTPKATRDKWAWVTGGEPTDHDVKPLLKALRMAGYATAIATSGIRRVIPPVDWLSVSPHTPVLTQRFGSELKLVDGLGGIDLERWSDENPDDTTDFMLRYVQPLSVCGVESKASVERCLEFLKTHSNWSLSRQDHHHWGVA